jgi:hypothetical protein
VLLENGRLIRRTGMLLENISEKDRRFVVDVLLGVHNKFTMYFVRDLNRGGMEFFLGCSITKLQNV